MPPTTRAFGAVATLLWAASSCSSDPTYYIEDGAPAADADYAETSLTGAGRACVVAGRAEGPWIEVDGPLEAQSPLSIVVQTNDCPNTTGLSPGTTRCQVDLVDDEIRVAQSVGAILKRPAGPPGECLSATATCELGPLEVGEYRLLYDGTERTVSIPGSDNGCPWR